MRNVQVSGHVVPGIYNSEYVELNNEDLSAGEMSEILSSMDDLVFLMDKDRNFKRCFQMQSPDLLFPPALFLNKNITEVPFPVQVLSLIQAAFDKAEKDGITQSIEYKLTKDKTEKWYNAKISVIGGSGFTVVVRDITKWKNLIFHFQENEKRYQLLAENTTDLIVLYNTDGTIAYISPAVDQLLGFTAESLTGVNPSFLIHEDDKAYIEAHFKPELFPGDARFIFEYRLRNASGEWLHFRTIRRFIRNEKNEVVHVLACCMDITHRVKYDAALKKSEAHYKLLADNILDLVALHNVNGIFEYVSPSAYTVLGYEPAELVGKNAFDLIHPEDAAGLFEKNNLRTSQGIDSFKEEFRILHKEGHYVYFQTTIKVLRDKANNAQRFLSASRDITNWKQSQFALKESEEKYKGLVENVDNLIMMVDREMKYLFANQTAASFLRVPVEAIAGKRMGSLLHSDTAKCWLEKVQQVFTENVPMRWETSVEVNGATFWLRTGFNPVRNSRGEIYAVLLNAIDITNIKRTERLLEEQNKGLKEIAFLQSHVLRSPLANIQHLISLLDKKSLSEENKLIIDLLQVSATNLDNAVKHIVEKTYMPQQ